VLKYIITRLLLTIPTIFGLAVFDFLLLYLTPGGPTGVIIQSLRSTGTQPSPAVIAELKKQYGLDQPAPIQFLHWIFNVVQGNLGNSYFSHESVTSLIFARLQVTLVLAITATLIALAIAIPLGVAAAVRRNSAVDYVGTVVSLVGISMPTFWLGFLLIDFLALELHVFPAVGYASPFTLNGVRYLILPALTLSFSTLAIISRVLRASMVEALGEDYILTARSKGLKERIVVYRHALRNALLPTLTLLGLYFGSNLGGVVTIEYTFHYLGLGDLAVNAMLSRDYPLIEGFVLYTGVVFVLANAIVDIFYAIIDPRIRLR
jgi:peptide/nickel transport system permease protein